MNLSVIQYDAIMNAIEMAKNAIADDTFIDPYGENPHYWTNENILEALEEVEDKIISANIPTI